MIAYHNKPEIKAAILAQLQAHHDADELVKGQYWQNGKGCAVGCTIHGRNHADYEILFGIPQILAQLEDRIFEGLPNEKAMEWPLRFMRAINPGHDLSLIGWKFLHWILTDEIVNPGINHPLVKDVVAQTAQVICAIAKGEPLNESAARDVASAARGVASAARGAESGAAWSAAWSAESAAWSAASAESSERGVASAASAAWSAERGAESAESAESAAWSAESAAWSAEWSAASAAYTLMADKLISLIEEANS